MQARLVVTFVFGIVASLGCSRGLPAERFEGPAELVLLHSADTHSQLFPWTTVVGSADARRGLGASGELVRVGGFARLATLVRGERSAAPRVLHLDSGDLFQGSLTFERFGGEPEVLAFDALGVDAQALGNHELDDGAGAVRAHYGRLATFPLLAANYAAEGRGGVAEVLEPFVVLDAAGLRVGVIGVGNAGSVPALQARPNQLGAVALETAAAVQAAIDVLRPLVNLIVAVTHLGLTADQALVRATSGLDVVLGGHQHIALDEPAWVADCSDGGATTGTVKDAWGRERTCTPRNVPIVHSGAYAKFLGKLALTLDDDPEVLGTRYDPLDGHEIRELAFELLPVGADTPEDAGLNALLEPYRPAGLDSFGFVTALGFAPAPVERAGVTGADSPLGNFAAEAVRRLSETELAVLGASSLRADLPPGVLDAEVLARALPFDDPLVRVRVSGAALERAFEAAARSASARDCRTQLHVAGLLVHFVCPCQGDACVTLYPAETEVPCRTDADCTAIGGACKTPYCFAPVVPESTYELTTTAYLAAGGSRSFELPPAALVPAGDGVLAAVTEAVRSAAPCGTDAKQACTSGCARAVAERIRVDCEAVGLAEACPASADLCARAEERCRTLPCLDANLASRDGRIRFYAP